MAYRSFGRFRQAFTHLDTPPLSISHHPVSAIARAFDPKVGQEAVAQTERDIERLHAKIGQLTIENDFFAKRFGR
jgi:hypothetical protein